MDFKYKTATQEDIDILVTTRIEVLRAANKLDDQADMTEVTDNVTDDEELVAVIAAAIAAAEGTTTDGFVVRSIRRRPSNKWNR